MNSCPNSEGNGPLKKFRYKLKLERAVRFPNDGGIVNAKKFSPSSRISSDDISPIASGINPDIEFPKTSNSAVLV